MSAAELIKRLGKVDNLDPSEQTAVAITVAEWLRDEATERARIAGEIAKTTSARNYYTAAAETLDRLYRGLRLEILRSAPSTAEAQP